MLYFGHNVNNTQWISAKDQDQEKDKDSLGHWWRVKFPEPAIWSNGAEAEEKEKILCLLYTSDAADE